MFEFIPQWKEILEVISKDGSFSLDLSMGVLSVYLPTEEAWKEKAPIWAKNHYLLLKQELEQWCVDNKANIYVESSAPVYSNL